MVRIEPKVPHNVPENTPQSKASSTQSGRTFTHLNSKENRLPISITNQLPTQRTTDSRDLKDSEIKQRSE